MRRFTIAAFMSLLVVGLSAGSAAAQYVSSPGSSPSVGAAGFGGQSAEVMGESVTRDDAPAAGVAGLAGSPAAATDSASADDSAAVAGEVATRGEAVGGPDDLRDLGSQTARSAGTGRGGSLLAFTGIALAVMALAGAALVGAGAVLRRFFGQTQEA